MTLEPCKSLALVSGLGGWDIREQVRAETGWLLITPPVREQRTALVSATSSLPLQTATSRPSTVRCRISSRSGVATVKIRHLHSLRFPLRLMPSQKHSRFRHRNQRPAWVDSCSHALTRVNCAGSAPQPMAVWEVCGLMPPVYLSSESFRHVATGRR